MQAAIAHHGGDDAGVGVATRLHRVASDDGHDSIAVHELAGLVDEDAAVAVAIECDTDLRASIAHELLERFRMRRAASVVDVDPVGISSDRDDLRAELRERTGCDATSATVGAVEREREAVEFQARRGRFP